MRLQTRATTNYYSLFLSLSLSVANVCQNCYYWVLTAVVAAEVLVAIFAVLEGVAAIRVAVPLEDAFDSKIGPA